MITQELATINGNMNFKMLTSRNIDINRYYSVTTTSNRVTVVIISAPICTTSHADHPTRIRHLVIDLSESRSHFVG